jgi:hypothetical protein
VRCPGRTVTLQILSLELGPLNRGLAGVKGHHAVHC